MAYCTESEVFAAVKEDAYNSLLGEQYIEDVEERKKRLQPLVEEAIERCGRRNRRLSCEKMTMCLCPRPPRC